MEFTDDILGQYARLEMDEGRWMTINSEIAKSDRRDELQQRVAVLIREIRDEAFRKHVEVIHEHRNRTFDELRAETASELARTVLSNGTGKCDAGEDRSQRPETNL